MPPPATSNELPPFQPDLMVGGLEVGVLVGVCLFGVHCVQTYMYLCSFKKDPWSMKAVVLFVWFLDLLHTVAICHLIYSLTVSLYGEGWKSLFVPPISIDISILLSGLIGPIEQGWFTRRLWMFSKNVYLTGICALLSLARLVGSTSLAVVALHRITLVEYTTKWWWLITSIMVVSTVNDVLLATFLAYCLSKNKSRSFQQMSRVIDKLMVCVIESGVITSLGAVSLLVLFMVMPLNSVYMGVFMILAKLYSNALLASLNARKSFSRLFGDAITLQDIDHPNGTGPSAATASSGTNRSGKTFSFSGMGNSSSNRSGFNEYELPTINTTTWKSTDFSQMKVTTCVDQIFEDHPYRMKDPDRRSTYDVFRDLPENRHDNDVFTGRAF